MSNPRTKRSHASYNRLVRYCLYGMSTYGLIYAYMHDIEAFMHRSMLYDSIWIERPYALVDADCIPKADYKAGGHRHPMNRLPIRPGLPFG